MPDVVVVGAGDFAGEVAAWILDSPNSLDGASLIGFIDDDPQAAVPDGLGVGVIGSIQEFVPQPGQLLVMGLSDPTLKEQISGALEAKGCVFSTFLHRTCVIAAGASVGRGTVACPHAVVSVGAVLGEFSTLNLSATIGHHAVLAPFCSIMSHGDVMGHASLGPRVLVGSRGGVLPRVKVGADAIVAAGSTAMRHVLPRTTVIGTPAKRLEGAG